jgi:hypothetical protein
MQFCTLTMCYRDKKHIIPFEAVIEANNKLQEYNRKEVIGSFLYGQHLILQLKEKYKCPGSSGSRAEP